MRPVRYLEAAENELLAEVAYLEDALPGLGKRFFNEIKRAERLVGEFPEASEEIRPGIRKRLVRTFRFSLVYAIQPEEIVIIAVAHPRRRPGYWTNRLRR